MMLGDVLILFGVNNKPCLLFVQRLKSINNILIYSLPSKNIAI